MRFSLCYEAAKGSLNHKRGEVLDNLKLKWTEIDKNTKQSNQFTITKGRGRFYLNQCGERKGSGPLQKMLKLAEELDNNCECCNCGKIPKRLNKKDLLPDGWINFGIKI